ncbi:rhodanese-like domain-containing protein [Marinobacterium stanieri]|uniref:rhodanese-like domain-containing protein n=1 Tax=Marinobacterium stanieri TaxID=49186 RepID=UPI00192A8795|nr:rhodanese-like domain-containing protein [Marinobacterium stanieri]
MSPVWSAGSDQDRTDLYFSWQGYRIGRYRSPTPERAEGGTRIDVQQLVRLQSSAKPAPILLDVQPVSWQSGIFLQTRQRYNLPGSVWLPNVGLGELNERWTDYFQTHLQRITQGDKQRAIVVYCTADCWMSWNAVKRANQWGYQQLYWFAEGTDGWREAERKLVAAQPVPLPDKQKLQDTDRPDTTR